MRVLLLAFSFVLALSSSAAAASARATALFAPGDGGPTKLTDRGWASLDEAERSRGQDASSQPQNDTTVKPVEPAVNPDELGVSIDRIRLRFRRNSLFQNVFDPSKLRITAYVDVVGRAPEIRLFGSDPKSVKEQLTSRAVPFGAPTHQDILQMWTPPEFRTPPMDLTAIMTWLAQQLQKKEEK